LVLSSDLSVSGRFAIDQVISHSFPDFFTFLSNLGFTARNATKAQFFESGSAIDRLGNTKLATFTPA